MGKEWYFPGKSSSKSRRTRSDVNVERDTNVRSTTTTSAGCMCAVFQLFDFHHFQYASNLQTDPILKPTTSSHGHFDLPEEPNIPKGSEAPRNSLKSEEGASLSSIIEDEEAVESLSHIQMGIYQIKTTSNKSNDVGSDTSSNSPGTKTPSLVARLMGLDLLPDQPASPTTARHVASSPASARSARTQPLRPSPGTRSLPASPRVSSSSRRSDVDHHHRLSLQISKENDGPDYDNDLRSPGYYARQIVKQVKESVITRRVVGSDITNTVRTRSDHHHHRRRDYDLVNKRSPSPSPSPKLDEQAMVRAPLAAASTKREQEKEKSKGRRINNAVKKDGNGGRSVIRQKIMQEETFVFGPTSVTANGVQEKSKCKKTPLSNDLLNLNVVPITLLAVKKNNRDVVHDRFETVAVQKTQKNQPAVAAGSEAARESKRARPTSLLSCSPQKHSASPHVLNPRNTCPDQNDDVITPTTVDASGALRRYVARILGRTGVSAACHVSFANWFSPSHPLDPSVFHRLEIYYSTYFIHNTNPNSHGQLLSLCCNRKLVFDVVDELLVDILRPYINLKPWIRKANYEKAMQGSDLIVTLCSRVEGFPCKDCQVLEDIDTLIEKDLRNRNDVSFEEEGEALVMEIEKDLVDTLVHETALVLFGDWI